MRYMYNRDMKCGVFSCGIMQVIEYNTHTRKHTIKEAFYRMVKPEDIDLVTNEKYVYVISSSDCCLSGNENRPCLAGETYFTEDELYKFEEHIVPSNEEVKPTTVYRMFGYNSSYLKSEWNSYLEDKMDNLRAMRCQ